ncbi:hypothetical protein Tco_1001659 [Tanacetum coccineum]
MNLRRKVDYGGVFDPKRDKYFELPPLHPCFQPPQPYSKASLVSPNESDEVDIDSMTIVEYELYMANQSPRKNRLNDHTYGFTSKFCDQSSCPPIPQPEDKELSLKEVLNNLFRMGAENLRGIKQEEVQVEECNEGNMEEIWDITIEDVERLKRLLTPTIEALPKPKPMVQPYVPLILFPNEVSNVTYDMMQPLTPQAIHITPPNDDYVALAAIPILVKLPKEFDNEPLSDSLTTEDDECNPMSDMEELEQVLFHDPF